MNQDIKNDNKPSGDRLGDTAEIKFPDVGSAKILYVDTKKVRKTLSNTTFEPVIIYQAYTDNAADRIPYYPRSFVSDLLKQIEDLKNK